VSQGGKKYVTKALCS